MQSTNCSKNVVKVPSWTLMFFVYNHLQEDKDLVLEFVENGGLNSLIKVGSECDQTYQNYILRGKNIFMYKPIALYLWQCDIDVGGWQMRNVI